MATNQPGRVAILNGSASAGKSSLARAVHDRADSLWLVMRQDDFAQNLIDRWVVVDERGSGERSRGFTFVREPNGTMTVEAGVLGHQVLRGYREAVAAVARAGNDVLVDEAMFDDAGREQWCEILSGLDTTWIKVDCALDIAEQRERARPDRRLIRGLARGLYERVHRDVRYDLTVDTSVNDLDVCVQRVLELLADDSP